MIDPIRYGVSFSAKQCYGLHIDPKDTLAWLIDEGWRRFRLMSYWDESEKIQGTHDFRELDRQIAQVSAVNGVVTLCLGARQPRWPENHWPDWAWEADKDVRSKALLEYIAAVVDRYKDSTTIVSYQLENEALLKNFGRRAEVDRSRLRQEYDLVRQLDPSRPVIMTTSTSWGIPVRQPRPMIVGFSYYQVVYNSKKKIYTTAFHKPWLDKMRASAIRILWRKPSFIHELQCEPWGPGWIGDMAIDEQNKSMSPEQIRTNIQLAQSTNLYPIDLWGGEWWYVRSKDGSSTISDSVTNSL